MSRIEELIKEKCPDGVEYKKLGNLCSVITKQTGFDYSNHIKQSLLLEPNEESVPYIQTKFFSGKRFDFKTDYYVPLSVVQQFPKITLNDKCLLFSIVGASIGNVGLYPGDRVSFLGGAIGVAKVLPEYSVDYLFYCIEGYEFQRQILKKIKGAGQATITIEDIREFEIPVPPIEVQQEIVRILDKFTELEVELQAELDARKKQYEYYLAQFISNNSKFEIKTLGEIGTVRMCKRILKDQTDVNGEIPFFKIGTFGGVPDVYISRELFEEYKEKYNYPQKGNVLISASGTIGRTVVFDGEPAYFQDSNIVWLEHDSTQVIDEYLEYVYKTKPWKISTGGTIARLYNDNIINALIPVPSIEEQKKIVIILGKYKKICEDIQTGLPAEIEARHKQYEYYRDKLLTFERKVV